MMPNAREPSPVREAMLEIIPTPAGTWSVVGGYGSQPFSFSTKGGAIRFFLAWAELHAPCEVKIYDKNGNVERTLHFPGGKHLRTNRADRRQKQVPIDFPDRRRRNRRARR